jgi:SAM-dependent methyltransferase
MLPLDLRPTELCVIMGEMGSDKGAKNLSRSRHNYTQHYHALFGGRRHEPLRVFELGLGTNDPALPSSMGVHGVPGASVRGWARYFPNASIFGADIDRNILFETERIKTFYCDQTDTGAIAAMWDHSALREADFDIIVEDGLHLPHANLCFFFASIHKLRPGGHFVIEDVHRSNMAAVSGPIRTWAQEQAERGEGVYHVEEVCRPSAQGTCVEDNNLIVVSRERPRSHSQLGQDMLVPATAHQS